MSSKTLVLRAKGGAESLMVEGRTDSWQVHRRSETEQAQLVHLPDGRISAICSNGRQICGRVLPRSHGEIEVSTPGGVRRLALADRLRDLVDHAVGERGAEEADEEIHALMPGRVVEVVVTPGDTVQAGSLLLVLEAMKMQNEIRAEHAAVVGNVGVAPGEAVERGTLMLTLRPGR